MANYHVACKCGRLVEVNLSYEQINRIRAGVEKLQDIMPFGEYTPEQREMFISGMCQECWNQLFPPEEEDEYPDDMDMELSGGFPDM